MYAFTLVGVTTSQFMLLCIFGEMLLQQVRQKSTNKKVEIMLPITKFSTILKGLLNTNFNTLQYSVRLLKGEANYTSLLIIS